MLKKKSKANLEKIKNYTHFTELPLKLVACWDWYPKPLNEIQTIVNYTYLCFIIFNLTNILIMLIVNMYTEWSDKMTALEKFSDSLPYVASLYTVVYFSLNRSKLYQLQGYCNKNFKFHSARGLTNVTMYDSYKSARNFAYAYLTCSLCSSTMYASVPFFGHYWTKTPVQTWFYMDVSQSPYIEITFLRELLAQTIMGITLGELGVFFATNSIILCGQLDVLCCSVRNARFTALLQNGVPHRDLVRFIEELKGHEKHNYLYSRSETTDSDFNFDEKVNKARLERKIYFDIYNKEFDAATESAFRECARVSQIVAEFKNLFQSFISPLLVVRVIQVTLYMCILLFVASKEFNMVTVEYLIAVALDIFIYCYYGNQIIVQADRVSTAAYQCSWHTMGVRPRRLLLNILLANKKKATIKAGRFLTMDLRTFLAIIKTSFSYYTLLVNVNVQ